MDKQKKRQIGVIHLRLKLIGAKEKEWTKVIRFLEKRAGINDGRDRLIKEAHIERNKVREEIKDILEGLKK